LLKIHATSLKIRAKSVEIFFEDHVFILQVRGNLGKFGGNLAKMVLEVL